MKYHYFVIAFALFFGFLAYVLTRGWQALPVNTRMIFLQLFGGLFVLLMTGLFFENAMWFSLSRFVTFTGYTFLIAVSYLFFSFIIVDIIRLLNSFLHFAPAGMHTFRLWAMLGSLGIISVALVAGNYKFNHPSVVTLNLTVDKPLQHKKIKIVAASDIHLGNAIDNNMLKKYVKMINEQKPDIVLLLGDITDRSASPLSEQNMKFALQEIHAPKGIFAIRGNHEYYSGRAEEIAGYLRSSGIKVLLDSTCLVDNSLYIVGRDDRTNTKRKPLSELVQGLDKNIPTILLDHQPFKLEEAEKNGIDLQLSGHTHNGQFFPANLYVKSMFELGYGYLRKGKTQYYVSSGLGLWGPKYRIGTQSELVVINLAY